jgi:hypothetical protein
MTDPTRASRPTWAAATALGMALFVVYAINGREIGAGDCVPAELLPVAILRGDGLTLDRFNHLWKAADPLPYYVARKRDHTVSRYPIGASLLALPLTAPQLAVLDRVRPGWEADPASALGWSRRMGKISAAGLGALTGVAIYFVLYALDLGTVALAATLITTLGSNLWVTGSQSLWQHGPAALALAVTLALLLPPPTGRLRLLLAGGACAAMVVCRPNALLFAALIFVWVVVRYRDVAVWFVPLPLACGALLAAYNLWYFGALSGGYPELISMSYRYWGADIADSAFGTLVSPSHGLFVFSPWIPLTLAAVPAVLGRLKRAPLVGIVLCGLPLLFAELAVQSTWWAGWSFGPRYWTEVMPLFAILLGFALEWSRASCRPLFAGLLITGALAIAIQAIGAFCYPSSWYGPSNDNDLARLWSWRDTELTRCLREGPHGWE